MTDIPYWQQRQALKLGRSPEGNKEKGEKTANDSKTTENSKGPDKKKNAKKTGNRIKKRSKKQVKVIRELAKLYPIFLADRPLCKIQSPICTRNATVVNHDRGRGANVLNQKDWTECCPPCNGYIEENHDWAEARGFKKSRHKKISE